MYVKILEDNKTTIMECATFSVTTVEGGKRIMILDDEERLVFDPDNDPPYIFIMNGNGKTVDTIQCRVQPKRKTARTNP